MSPGLTFCMVLCIAALASVRATGSEPPPVRDLFSDTWAATDALGRSLPDEKEVGPPRKDRVVGIFYFLWLGQHGTDLYDNTQLLRANPANSKYGPPGAFHWWGEPRFGYYSSEDEWVIRRHAQMLSDAGVDVVIFDVTNAFTYDDNVRAVCRVYEAMRQLGEKTPQIAFIAHSSSAETVKKLYDRFYAKNLYPDLWFRWKGKPLMMAPDDGLPPEIRSFFSFRDSWAWTKGQEWFGDGKDKWAWIDNFPQEPGWHENPAMPEEISVCVAQHPVSNIGRSFHDGKEPPPDRIQPDLGLCFDEQWRRALAVDPEFIFITGWNEWVAQRFLSDGDMQFLGRTIHKGDTFFVDQYNEEYSRDIEPMKGGHGDNYYYQMIANIRRYKGVRPLPKPSRPKRIKMEGDFAQWASVKPEYRDSSIDTSRRDHLGWGDKRYVNVTGRNDFETMKVARDKDHLYFYARTRTAITPPTGKGWMWLLLDTDSNPKTGWEGYDFILNRTLKDGSIGVLERHTGKGWSWEPVADVKLTVRGNEMQVAIPRRILGLEPGKGPLKLRFKWADNAPESGDIEDFLDHGDTAPDGRFSYRYEE